MHLIQLLTNNDCFFELFRWDAFGSPLSLLPKGNN